MLIKRQEILTKVPWLPRTCGSLLLSRTDVSRCRGTFPYGSRSGHNVTRLTTESYNLQSLSSRMRCSVPHHSHTPYEYHSQSGLVHTVDGGTGTLRNRLPRLHRRSGQEGYSCPFAGRSAALDDRNNTPDTSPPATPPEGSDKTISIIHPLHLPQCCL